MARDFHHFWIIWEQAKSPKMVPVVIKIQRAMGEVTDAPSTQMQSVDFAQRNTYNNDNNPTWWWTKPLSFRQTDRQTDPEDDMTTRL